jgi:malate dehydrogenase (oxaloacetate-decarboxylating)
MDTFELHKRNTGMLSIVPTAKIETREDLTLVYTPEVGKICMAIKDNPELLSAYTIAGKTVAVISNGTAVLGFGNIGPKAALPVMEGKAVIFKEFAGIDAYPICISETDTEKFIAIVKSIALNFAGINLEDIAAPACFEIEQRLSDELPIPVIHDDQHGTAIVTLAALFGALTVTKKERINVAISGAGAAGVAIMNLLLAARDDGLLPLNELRVFDSKGLVALERTDLTGIKQDIATKTKQAKALTFAAGIEGMDVFIGVSAPGILTVDHVRSMNAQPIVFALANPVPEILPDLALQAGAAIVATGRSDFPNQINNALVYPGLFKGLLENNIKKVEMHHKLVVAKAITAYQPAMVTATNLLPSILDKNIPLLIAKMLREVSS